MTVLNDPLQYSTRVLGMTAPFHEVPRSGPNPEILMDLALSLTLIEIYKDFEWELAPQNLAQ